MVPLWGFYFLNLPLFFYIYARMQTFDIDSLMTLLLNTLDYWFWAPLVFWFWLYRWFFRVSYPIYFKKLANKRVKWAYVPKWKFYWKPLDTFFTLIFSIASALPAIWAVIKWLPIYPWFYGFAVSPLFILFGLLLRRIARGKTAKLFQAAYFLEYRKACYECDIKGTLRNESDIQNRTFWSFTKKLKNAEAHGCLWKYVNAMAKSKKIPRDIYAEIN